MFLKQPEWFECVIQIKELSQSWLYQYPIIKSEKDNKMLYCTSGLACYQQFKKVEETSHSLCWSQQSGTNGVGVIIIQDSKVLSNLQSSLPSKFPSLDVINNWFKIVFQCHIREPWCLVHIYVLSQERDGSHFCFLIRSRSQFSYCRIKLFNELIILICIEPYQNENRPRYITAPFRVTLIVPSFHPGWEYMENLRGNLRKFERK